MSLLLDLRRKWFAYFIKRLQSNDSAIVEVSFLKNLLINFMYSFKKYLLIIVYFENLFVNLQEYQHLIKLLCEVLDGDVDPLCNMQPKLQTQKTKPNNFPRQVCIFRQNLGGGESQFLKLLVYNFRFLLEIYLNGVAKGFLKFSSANLER